MSSPSHRFRIQILYVVIKDSAIIPINYHLVSGNRLCVRGWCMYAASRSHEGERVNFWVLDERLGLSLGVLMRTLLRWPRRRSWRRRWWLVRF